MQSVGEPSKGDRASSSERSSASNCADSRASWRRHRRADYFAAGFRAGEIACAVLSGEATPADFDVINIEDPTTSMNSANAEAQGVTIPESIAAIADDLA